MLQMFRAKELLDNTLALIKNAMSGAIVDPDRLVIGTEEGLFCLDLDRTGNAFHFCSPLAPYLLVYAVKRRYYEREITCSL